MSLITSAGFWVLPLFTPRHQLCPWARGAEGQLPPHAPRTFGYLRVPTDFSEVPRTFGYLRVPIDFFHFSCHFFPFVGRSDFQAILFLLLHC